MKLWIETRTARRTGVQSEVFQLCGGSMLYVPTVTRWDEHADFEKRLQETFARLEQEAREEATNGA